MSDGAENGSREPEMQRAEEMLDQIVQTAGDRAAQASVWIAKHFARSREEIEDIWAEAQSLGRGNPN